MCFIAHWSHCFQMKMILSYIVALRQVWIMADLFLLCRNQLFTLGDVTQHQTVLWLWPMEVRLTSKWSWQVLFIILLDCILHSPVLRDADLSSSTNGRKDCVTSQKSICEGGYELYRAYFGDNWFWFLFPVHGCCTYLTNWKQKSCNLTSWRRHLFLFRSYWQLLKRALISKNISGRYIICLFLSKHIHTDWCHCSFLGSMQGTTFVHCILEFQLMGGKVQLRSSTRDNSEYFLLLVRDIMGIRSTDSKSLCSNLLVNNDDDDNNNNNNN